MKIMSIKEIYEAFDQIGCLSFATVNELGEPETRIAHLRGYDEQGIYFMTMYTKDFYRQLKYSRKVSVNGLCAHTQVAHDEQGMPEFDGGYAIRMMGTVEEISMEKIIQKNNPIFNLCIKDQEKYPAMVVFCITSARGDIFDYDFKMEKRKNKLERFYFSYNGERIQPKGLWIHQELCVGCGKCQKGCSFLAIQEKEGKYEIQSERCDECGDCYLNCPVGAISHHGGAQ